MKLLNYAARYEKGTLVAAAVAGVAGGTLAAWPLTLVVEVLRTGNATTAQMWAFAAATVAGAGLRYLSSDILTRYSQRRLTELRRDLMHRVISSGLRHVEELGSSRLLVALTDDVGVISGALASFPVFITQLAMFLACWLYVAWLSWQVWAVGTVLMAVAIATYLWIVGRAAARGRKAREEQDTLYGHYRALTDGFTELKLHRPRRTAFLSRTVDGSLALLARLNVTALGLYNTAANYHQLMFFTMVGVLVFGAARWSDAGSATVTAAILALLYARAPLDTLVNWVPAAMRAEVAFEKYGAVMAALPPETKANGVEAFGDTCQRLDLSGVCYEYTGEDREGFGLGPIDLTLRAGEILFITGGNGSGKSTLAKVIAGLYLPSAGQLSIDGRPITPHNRDHYRQLVSSIFASFHLFRELLGLERPGLDREAGEWLGRMRLSDRIQVRDGMFSDLSLSTGQRKRVALLVTMLEDRPICLLDEWAADQDAQYREEFYSALLPELKARGKMVIVISHDDRYYALGDRVIKLERGRIVADEAAGLCAAPEVNSGAAVQAGGLS